MHQNHELDMGFELQIVGASSHGCYTKFVIVGLIDIGATD
jgi:hypothetical protein